MRKNSINSMKDIVFPHSKLNVLSSSLIFPMWTKSEMYVFQGYTSYLPSPVHQHKKCHGIPKILIFLCGIVDEEEGLE